MVVLFLLFDFSLKSNLSISVFFSFSFVGKNLNAMRENQCRKLIYLINYYVTKLRIQFLFLVLYVYFTFVDYVLENS